MSTFTKVAALTLGLLLATQATATGPRDNVDWPKFLSRHDLLYARLPEKWGEGAFTGNGLLGAMAYTTDDGKALRFRIGRSDVMVQGAGSPHRLPIGDLVLLPQGNITGGSMRLDLWNAEITGTLKTDKGEITFRTFTHATDLIQVIDTRSSEGELGHQWRFDPGLAVNPRVVRDSLSKKEPIPDSEKNPAPVIGVTGDAHTIDQKLNTGGGHATAWCETGEAGPRRTVYLSVGWGDDALTQATTAVTRAANSALPDLEQSHRAWWHAFYPASFLSIPDTRLESFYWIQMYKLASATRADHPAIDLMGPWFNETPWPRIWWNLNLQLTYYPVYAANHLDLGESLCRMIDAGKDNLAKNAREFSDDSEAVARTTGYDCRGNVGGELCNYPWALHNYYMQYRYSMDDAMLRDRLLPRMKRAMNYYYHVMAEGPDGKLHITQGQSPEYHKEGGHPDCNIDLALVRWICQALIDSCHRLKLDDPLLPKWKDTLARLTPYPTDDNGLMVSADTPWTLSHRHYSHLLMIYPLYVMNWDQPENRPLITQSFDHWMSMPNAFRGYSYTGAASICAQIGRNNDTAKYLHFFVDAKGRFGLLPNTHYTESGPVIETPLSGARTIQDMLIQSWGDKIRLFPGVPDDWKDVTFDKLRTEGAFLVSAARKDGKTAWVHVESLAGEPCRLKTDIADVESDHPIKSLGDGIVELQLNKGDAATLWPKGPRPDTAVDMVNGDDNTNSFGLPQ